MFTHLHVHTEYSMLDGLARLEPLVDRAVQLDMNSLAITDHGGMYGAIDFYRIATRAGIKPILGCEMYVAAGSRFDRNPNDKIFHMTVLAKNAVGYKNLVTLVTLSHLEGYYKKPRVDRQLIEQHREGLIILSGCPSGEIPWLISQGRLLEARDAAGWYQELFGDYYLEIMQHGAVPQLPAINKGLVQLGEDLDIPLVATNDSHYVMKEHSDSHDVLLCIQTNSNIDDEKRLKFGEDSYYLRSYEEMVNLYSELPMAITNTQLIADSCELKLDFTQARLPKFPVPEGMDSDEYLAKIAWNGLRSRLPQASESDENRLIYELEVIKQARFPDYFLVVWDIAKFVRDNDILFAVRGSAAASLVLYCLGVTDVNPMPFNLVFERFLNLERKEMPDIDMDFQDDRRQEVINYCTARYGREHVAHIITFGTFGARQSVRDAGRVLGMPLERVDRVARMIPERLNIDLNNSLKESPQLKESYEALSETKDLIDTARELEGVTRHKSVHAAGVVISKDPLNEVVPLEFTSRGEADSTVMTQYSMDPIASLGLLKMDFLGLVNLTVLDRATKMIGDKDGSRLNLLDIPLDDKETFGLLSRGETVGVFQLESAGMTRNIRELQPSTLNDVAAMIALFRPGPMEQIGTFIDAKHQRRSVTYLHPALKDILEETYGVIVYQDQVLHIARLFAGYSLGEADIVRKAMGKKVPAIMREEKDKFVAGALEQGYEKGLADQVFNLVEPFAGYAFNKAHSVSYGLISYWTAYLKTHHPVEYMAAYLNAYVDNKDKFVSAVADCRRMGIKILPPDINRSFVEFALESTDEGDMGIRFGFSAVKNVGSESMRAVVSSRGENGFFDSVEDVCRNADLSRVNRKTIECLIKAGAFDYFGDREGILSVSERISALAQSEAELRRSSQTTMFDLFGESIETPLASIDIPDENTSEQTKRSWEVELMGISLSTASHLTAIMAQLSDGEIVMSNDIQVGTNGAKTVIAGQVSTVVDRVTRDNRPFKVVTVEMLDGIVEAVAWEDVLRDTGDLWEPGRILRISGNTRERDGDITISVSSAQALSLDEKKERSSSSRFRGDLEKDNYDGSANGSSRMVREGVSPVSSNQVEKPEELESDVPSASRKRLVLHLKETAEPVTDSLLLDDIKRVLLSSLGNDEVGLEIDTGDSLILLDWAPVRVLLTQELKIKLEEVMDGSGHITVQSVMF